MEHWFIEKLRKYDNIPAIGYGNKIYTYHDLINAIAKARRFLTDNKICAGEVVAIVSDYSFRAIALFLALLENKNIIVPITSKVDHEISERLYEGYCDRKFHIDDDNYFVNSLSNARHHNFVEELRNSNKSGLILFSSGSTGKPKAMIIDLDKLIESYRSGHSAYRTLVFLMFDHIGGVNTLFHILSSGGFAVFTQIRDADYVCKLVEQYQVELLPSSPTFLNLILISGSQKKYNLDSLKMITYGTESMPESLLRRLKEAFPNIRLKQTFGTSETGILSTKSQSDDSLFMKLGGKGFDYKVVNNQLYIKSQVAMVGYLNAENPFSEDGWFPTGDLVEVNDEGYIKIIGRTKEVINVGGEKVLPAEIESILLEMDEITDVMAYGEENSITGQNVAVDVVLKDWVDRDSIKKVIRTFCKGKLDGYKIPTRVNVVEKVNFGDRFKKIRRK